MISVIGSFAQAQNVCTSGRSSMISPVGVYGGRVVLHIQDAQRWKGGNVNLMWHSHHSTASLTRQKPLVPTATGGREVYQPFRPPPSIPSPKLGAATTEEQLQILKDRIGFWHEYASVIPILTRTGYAPSQIDEITGLTGVEQDKIVVASQVRSSLIASEFDEDDLRFFDLGGAELLYELRILSAEQRKECAQFVINRKMEPKSLRELARAVKDFERRRSTEGWSHFSSNPGDRLAFAYYRKSKEVKDDADVEGALNMGLEYAVSEKAREKILEALGQLQDEDPCGEIEIKPILQVIRLSSEEAAPTPIVLPLAELSVESIECTPALAVGNGPFQTLFVKSPWNSWVAVPGWKSIVSSASPVAILLSDASLLPSVAGKTGLRKDPILLVVDKEDKQIVQDSFFLVENDGLLCLKAGSRVLAKGYKPLGKVLVALRPPIAQSMDSEDWE